MYLELFVLIEFIAIVYLFYINYKFRKVFNRNMDVINDMINEQ